MTYINSIFYSANATIAPRIEGISTNSTDDNTFMIGDSASYRSTSNVTSKAVTSMTTNRVSKSSCINHKKTATGPDQGVVATGPVVLVA